MRDDSHITLNPPLNCGLREQGRESMPMVFSADQKRRKIIIDPKCLPLVDAEEREAAPYGFRVFNYAPQGATVAGVWFWEGDVDLETAKASPADYGLVPILPNDAPAIGVRRRAPECNPQIVNLQCEAGESAGYVQISLAY